MSKGRSGCANPVRIATPALLGKANNATQSGNTSGKVKESPIYSYNPNMPGARIGVEYNEYNLPRLTGTCLTAGNA
jgi:hypothetical protein